MQREIEELENRFTLRFAGFSPRPRRESQRCHSRAHARWLPPRVAWTSAPGSSVSSRTRARVPLAPHKPSAPTTALAALPVPSSPIEAARWQHIGKPVVHGTRTELWTRGPRTAPGETGGDGISKVRARRGFSAPTEHAAVALEPQAVPDEPARPRPP